MSFVRILSIAPLAVLLLGCSSEAPSDAPVAAPIPVAALPQPPSEPPQVGGLDDRGNLRVSDQTVHGFPLPLTSAVLRQHGSVTEVYAESNIERLLRFYRSRGHLITRTKTGWEIRHTPRTLKDLGVDGVSLGGAIMRMRQGPGPGWTLRVDSAIARPLRRPALTELLAAEERFRDEKAKGERKDATPTLEEKAEVEELKRRAFKRDLDTRRVRDLSREIYEYVQEHPEEGFVD